MLNTDELSERILSEYKHIKEYLVLWKNPPIEKRIIDFNNIEIKNWIDICSLYDCPVNNTYIYILNDVLNKRRINKINKIQNKFV